MSGSLSVWVPILVAVVTAFATVITVYLTGRANLKLEREKFETNSQLEREKFDANSKLELQRFEANSQLERQKFESSLVLHAIATGDQESAQKNLDFLVRTGFLPDPDGKIKDLANEPADTPVLPAPQAGERISLPTRPGVFRWPVRTGADPDAALVEATPVATTVEELIAEPRPSDMPLESRVIPAYQSHRAEGPERHIYQLEARIVGCKLQMSGNLHLNLQGETGQTMIANCPDPDPQFVAPGSRWVKEIAEVRREIEDKLQPESRKKKVNERVRITGVGFFNAIHGQWGLAPNGLELTPVLSIEWLEKCGAPKTHTRASHSKQAD
jgi:hypothetical protein